MNLKGCLLALSESVCKVSAGMIVGSKSGIQAGIGKVFAATKGGGVFWGEIFGLLAVRRRMGIGRERLGFAVRRRRGRETRGG